MPQKVRELGSVIRRHRRLWSLTDKQLAEKAGLSVNQVRLVEKNADNADMGSVRKLLNHFFLKVEYVVKYHDE